LWVFIETHRVWDDVRVDLPEQSPEQPASAQPAAQRPDPAHMRASDADRDKVADLLREALAEGRLSPEEHAERLDAVYAAKTYADLEPIVHDLPGAGEQPSPPSAPQVEMTQDADLPVPARQSTNIVAIFSGAERKRRWLVEPHTNVLAVFGGVELDFRQAVLTQREVTLNITCVFGGVEIKVPPGVRVIDSGIAVFGGRQLPGDDPVEPDAPVIRLTGFTLFGGVDVKRRPIDSPSGSGLGKALRERHREIQREFHERRREAHREMREHRRTERRHRRQRGC
jgi:hypothetical protein